MLLGPRGLVISQPPVSSAVERPKLAGSTSSARIPALHHLLEERRRPVVIPRAADDELHVEPARDVPVDVVAEGEVLRGQLIEDVGTRTFFTMARTITAPRGTK